MPKLNTLLNINGKILIYLYEKRDEKNLTKITQSEIAQELNLNRGTVNKCFSTLIKNDFLVHDKTHIGRYYLTQSATDFAKMFKKQEVRGKKA